MATPFKFRKKCETGRWSQRALAREFREWKPRLTKETRKTKEKHKSETERNTIVDECTRKLSSDGFHYHQVVACVVTLYAPIRPPMRATRFCSCHLVSLKLQKNLFSLFFAYRRSPRTKSFFIRFVCGLGRWDLPKKKDRGRERKTNSDMGYLVFWIKIILEVVWVRCSLYKVNKHHFIKWER